jgi:hypothetical protein
MVLLAVAVCAVGAVRSGIFNQSIWNATGQQRFLLYTAIFAVSAGVVFVVRRAALLPGFAACVLLYVAATAGVRPVMALVLFALGCYGIGLIVFRVLRLAGSERHRPLWLDVLALVAGSGIWAFAISFLAFAPWNRAAVHGLLLAIPAAVGARSLWNRGRATAGPQRASGPSAAEFGALALLLYVLGAQFLMSLKPEVSADGVGLHLVVPMHVAIHGSWHFDVTQVTWAVMPMTVEWCFTTLYLLGGEFAAKLLPFAFLCAGCVLIVLLCRRLTAGPAPLLMAAVYAATPVMQLITGAMFIDMPWAVYMLGAAVLIVHWTEWRDTAALPPAGILLGSAMATKVIAISFVAPCAAWVFFNCFGRKRGIDRKSLAALALAGLLFVVIASPPYAVAWVKTGNPVFPYFNDVFRSPHYSTTPNWADVRWQTRFSWRAPFDLTFRTSRFLESQNGAVGLSWIFLILLFLAAPKSMFTRPVVGALLIGGSFFLFTWSRASYIRYLIPAFPLLLFAFAAYLRAMRTEQAAVYRIVVGATAATILAGAFLLPSSGYWHKSFCLNPLEFRKEAAAYMEEMAPLRVMVDYLNRTAPGEPAAFFWVGMAGLRGRVYTSGTQTFEFMQQCDLAGTAEGVRDLMARNGIRHFVSPLPACGEPNMPQLTEFLKRYTLERFRGTCLYVAESKGAGPSAVMLP